MKKMILSIAALFAIVGIATAATTPVVAINVFPECTGANADTSVCKAKDTDKATGMVRTIINTIIIILGMVAVIMIVIGGLRYVTSSGDSNNLKGAKDTILYAVIGLVVAILAYAIVNFVVTRIM